MSEEEAKNVLIGLAVCVSPKLTCEKDCPFYEKDKSCKYINKQFEVEEAVKVLNKERIIWVKKKRKQ